MNKVSLYILAFFISTTSLAQEIDCAKFMSEYSRSVGSYSIGVDELDVDALSKLRSFLTESSDSHIKCSVYNKNPALKEPYKVIFLRDIGVKSAIRAYMKHPDEFIGQQIQEEYSQLNEAAKNFNKSSKRDAVTGAPS